MQWILLVLLLVVLSCSQKKNVKEILSADTTGMNTNDTTKPGTPEVNGASDAVKEINDLLAERSGGTMAVATDADANWRKDQFDYFIAPKRKKDPDYPYLAKGDFDGDGMPDAAALVKTKGTPEYQLAILYGQLATFDKTPEPVRIDFWKEDIDVCAISTYPKGELQGIDQPKANMKGDGINVEYYETASFVVYWDGKKFKRAQTGD